ncbi:MAG: hypothetical protein ACRDRL_08585 [Sciscionella sp.]
MSITTDPIAPASGRFALGEPEGTPPATDAPSTAGLRPWGMLAMKPAGPSMAKRGDPSADTTASTDGEDGPSSEDWNNDFHPDSL